MDTGYVFLSTFYLIDYFRESLLTFFKGSLIILCAVLFIITLHATVAPLYFMMLRMVFLSFLKAVATFFVVLISYAVFFQVLFRDVNEVEEGEMNKTLLHNTTIGEKNYKQNPFASISNAFLKVVFMTTGEYSIEAFVLEWYHVWIFVAFAATTIIIFNLITGLALDDVQKIRQKSRTLTLLTNAEFIIEIVESFKKEIKSDR